VDLELLDDQELFLETNRRFLTANWPASTVRGLIDDKVGFDRNVWDRGAERGWTSMLVPEECGGGSISGEGVADVAIVAEELGRALFVGPVIPSNVVAYARARWGTDQQSKEHLPLLAAGNEIAAWAIPDQNDHWGADAAGVEAAPISYGGRLASSPLWKGRQSGYFLARRGDLEDLTQSDNVFAPISLSIQCDSKPDASQPPVRVFRPSLGGGDPWQTRTRSG
jgi:hypothetical protein